MSTILHKDGESQPSQSSFFQSPAGGLSIYRTIQQNELCKAPKRPTLRAVNHTTKQVIFFQPACGSWNCPACALTNSKKAILRALKGYSELSAQNIKIDFLTLTSHEKLNAQASYHVLPKAWNKLNIRIKRASQQNDYFIVPEQHKNGRWHVHGMTTANLPKKWWKDNARECGLGYKSDVSEVVAVGSVAGYVAKYTGKMIQNSNFPKGARRLRMSHTWPELPPLSPPPGWQFSTLDRKKVMGDEIGVLTATGYTVVLADEKSSWHWIELFGGVE